MAEAGEARDFTISGHPNDTLGHGLTANILRQAGFEVEDLGWNIW